MLKRELGAESNEKLPHLFIPSKIATLVPEFAVEDLPLGRTATLVSEFAVKDLPLSKRSHDMMMMMMMMMMKKKKKMEFNNVSCHDIIFKINKKYEFKS